MNSLLILGFGNGVSWARGFDVMMVCLNGINTGKKEIGAILLSEELFCGINFDESGAC